MSDEAIWKERALEAEARCRRIAGDGKDLNDRIAFLRSALVATAGGIESNFSREFLSEQATSFLIADEEAR